MIKLGVVGVGGAGGGHVNTFSQIKGVKIVAVCDVNLKRAKEVGAKFDVPQVYRDSEEFLDKAGVEAISNATPDAFHAPVSLAAIRRGLHVLCEKPLATCYADAKKMADAARRKGVINMINFSYRDAPAIQKVHQMVQAGRVGKVRHFEAAYLQSWLMQDAWGDWRTVPAWLWRLSKRHGSKGVLGDVGVHILDFASFGTDGNLSNVICKLKTFDKGRGNRKGEYVFDANDSAVITAELDNGALGTIHTSRWASGHMNTVRLTLHGDKGAISVDLDRSRNTLEICEGANCRRGVWRTIKCPATPSIYERFIRSIRTGKNDQPDFARGALIQKALDACEKSDTKRAPVRV